MELFGSDPSVEEQSMELFGWDPNVEKQPMELFDSDPNVEKQPMELFGSDPNVEEQPTELCHPDLEIASAAANGYSWRKYGQKTVLGSEFPWLYYRCQDRGCPARKKVVRKLNGQCLEIIYRGQHNHELQKLLVQTEDGGAKKILVNDGTFVDDNDQDEPNPKRRTVRRTIVQTTSELDILDDGYRWRKYGQKEFPGRSCPRHYYKCATMSCRVRKVIWRDGPDLSTVITTYEGVHNHDAYGARKGSLHTTSGDTSQQKPQGSEIRLTGLELTELPTVEEWEVSKLIHLTNSQLLKLPENPICPILEDLSLKGNSKLRTIPPLFFDWMPALHVLDLSRTRIKSLPDSLFSLPKLKRLFLRHCNLLMKLSPKVGQLKGLQVLDLEGTEIMHLPGEVKILKKLKCLKVSFCELPSYRRVEEPDVLMISPGTLSALPLLEELSINVSPDDGRWNECVEPVVYEVSGLAWLYKLQFYFPSMEFLSHFQWFRFKAFKLTAGHLAAKRLMPRLPSDAEAELERYDKSFTSVHGDFESEMKNPVLQHADALFLDRHTTMKTLSVFGLDSFKHLRCCVIGECNELQVLFCVGQKPPHVSLEYLYLYYMKSLRHIWEGRLPPMVHLKSLTLRTCPMLSSIFSEDLIGSLNSLKSLQEIIIDDCPAIINLVRCNGFDCTSSSGTAHNNFLPSLKRISLHYLPQLNDIFDLSRSRDLEWMSIYHCPNLKSLPIDTASNKNLNKIMGERSWWESLEWQDTKQHSWDDVFVEQELCY